MGTDPASFGVHLCVSGTLTTANAAALRQDLVGFVQAFSGSVLELDLADVDEVDQDGLSVILAAHRVLEGRGGRLVLTGVTAPVRRLILSTGMSASFSLGEASLGRGAPVEDSGCILVWP